MKDEFDFEDPLEEVYAIRRKRSQMFGHDVSRIIHAACERMHNDIEKGTRTYVRLPIVRRASNMV